MILLTHIKELQGCATPGYESEENKQRVLQKLGRLKTWLKEDKSWRINFQFMEEHGGHTRWSRTERCLKNQYVNRIFVDSDQADVEYPCTSYIPSGKQDVPPLRGYKEQIGLWESIYFQAIRQLRMKHVYANWTELVASIAPYAITEHTAKFEEKYKPKTLAQFILQLKLSFEEPEVLPPHDCQRMAYATIEQKPKDCSFREHVMGKGN